MSSKIFYKNKMRSFILIKYEHDRNFYFRRN